MLSLLTLIGPAQAADHIDGTDAQTDAPTDIADLFAWSDGTQISTVVTFAGAGASDLGAVYDPDVVYGIHIDNDLDDVADFDIWVRYGQDSLGNWGIQVTNLPGAGAPVVGPVESVIAAPGGSVFTGLRDDPFFFDFGGFTMSVDDCATGTDTVQMMSDQDFFAGLNVTAIVLSFDEATAAGGSNDINIWATSRRDRASITP